jgi:glycosyltransferase involved in cell wall biosynthesis
MSDTTTPGVQPNTPCDLSVVIPTFNRRSVLEECLRALRAQTIAADRFEIVVADDGSSDRTQDTVQAFSSAGPPATVYLQQANRGANAARNRAIRAARGRILLIINDDTIATPGMLQEHLAAHAQHPDDRVAVLGKVTVCPTLPSSRLSPLHLDRAFAALSPGAELDWHAFLTCNISVKHTLLARGGLFEERLRYHEDVELGERLSHFGLRVVYRPGALGHHRHFLTEEEFFRIALRDAAALALWARIAPHLTPVLAAFGFEPALPLARRVRHRLVEAMINPATSRFWRWVARHCPRTLDGVSLRLYDQIYQCLKRSCLRARLSAKSVQQQ